MASYRFDKTRCELGIRHLENYQWMSDSTPDFDGQIVFRKTPKKNGSDHAADALRQHAQGYRGVGSGYSAQLEQYQNDLNPNTVEGNATEVI